MRGGGQKTKKGNGRLVPLFVDREDQGEGAEELGEQASVGLDTLLADQAAYQEGVGAHHKQEEVVLALGEALGVREAGLAELDERK